MVPVAKELNPSTSLPIANLSVRTVLVSYTLSSYLFVANSNNLKFDKGQPCSLK